MPSFATEQLRKIFIGGLNLSTTEESLKDYFSRWGECVDVVVMRFPDTRRSRGFGFVTYEKVESVDAVLNAKPHVLDGKDIEPKRAIARDEPALLTKSEGEHCLKIFVGGLAISSSEEEVRDCFTKFCEEAGHGHVEEVLIMRDRSSDRNRGFCFVTFDNPEIVDKVCSVKYFEIKGKTVEVRPAESRMAMKRKEERQYGSRRRLEDSKRDLDYMRDSGTVRKNFFGSGVNPMSVQGAMAGNSGMPFFGGLGGGNSGYGGSGGFGSGFGMNPMALAGMMNMLASSMGMNLMGGNLGMSDTMGGRSRGMGDYSFRNDMAGGFKSSSFSNDNPVGGSSGTGDMAGVGFGSQNSSLYNDQPRSGVGDMSGYTSAMSAMLNAAGVSPTNVHAAMSGGYGGKGDFGQFGSYSDQSSSFYGPSKGSSFGKGSSGNRSFKPY